LQLESKWTKELVTHKTYALTYQLKRHMVSAALRNSAKTSVGSLGSCPRLMIGRK
jgi:hypothetical protein